jgi:imidazolonepropionase
MLRLAIVNARVLTLAGAPVGAAGPRRGRAMHELRVIERGHIIVDGERIAALGPGDPPEGACDRRIDAHGRVVMPAFVDCHTHACWAGQRFDEFEMMLAGVSYLDVLRRGGGIMATVRAVRNASEDELADLLLMRLARMAALGTGAVEVKSGYGLDTETELKMLRAIRRVAVVSPLAVTPTFLGAHAIDRDNPRFVEQTINETLPAVVREFPGITCDAYCEASAWSLDDARRLFENARDLGCPLRVHADQFNSLGMTRLAVEMGAVSVDHLEATSHVDLLHLAHSRTMGVMLPCSGFHLDGRYAPGRAFVDAGGALAIATNYNPGSAPTPSMPFTIALACRTLKLTPAEAIAAATYNAACVLGLEDEVGSIEPGKRADVQILDSADERELGFEIAGAGPLMLMLGGQVVHHRAGTAEAMLAAEP